MSTKNLSKSVIQGGRSGYFKTEVFARIREERSAERTYLRHVAVDPDYDDENVQPLRRPAVVDQKDKLNPIYRFLDSRLGRRWDDVRSELFAKFDTRTTPGRHVLFDHLLKSVDEIPRPSGTREEDLAPGRRHSTYFLDAEGLLCKRKGWGFRGRRSYPRWKPVDWDGITCWLGNRKVGRCGAKFTWFVPTTGPNRVRAIYERNEIVYARLDEWGSVVRDPILHDPNDIRYRRYGHPTSAIRLAIVSYRQSRCLDAAEEKYFRDLRPDVQDKLLKFAPNSPSAVTGYR